MVNHVAFIWNIAESLRGPFKPSEYGSVVLPFTVLRRLDAVLADTKPAVLQTAKAIGSLPEMLQVATLTEASGHEFYNTFRSTSGSSSISWPKFVPTPLHPLI